MRIDISKTLSELNASAFSKGDTELIKTERGISHVSKRIAFCAIGIYLVIFAAILLGARLLDEPPPAETLGDITDSFFTEPLLHYQGQDYVFRSGEVENILILGVDGKRTGEEKAPMKGQADFLLLISIDRKNKCVTPIAIDRDTMTSVQVYGIFGDPAGTSVMQLCLAHAFSNNKVSGGENTKNAVSALLFGIPIQDYLSMDIDGIMLLNDAVGGIEVTLEEDFSYLDPVMTKGSTIKLLGKQAEIFVRGRMNTASGTNFFRAQRQMQYLSPLMQKLSALVQKDTQAIDSLLETLDLHLESSLSRAEMIRHAMNLSDYELMPAFVLPGHYRMGEDKAIEYWADTDSMMQLLLDTCYEKRE